MTEALALHDLWFGYGKRPAVRGVTLSVQPGDCYGFLGHNGAGKTTVMRLALGLVPVRRGTVRMFGIDALAAPRAARAQVGALVERPGFWPSATARQNLLWLAHLQGMPRLLAGAATDRALERCGLRGDAHRRVGTFSLGMRQRLGIAQALLGSPRLLLLDEPGNGLDPEGIADLRSLLRHLTRDEGVAVLLSSHQLQELEGLCTRIGVLRDGAMLVEGDLTTLRRQVQPRHLVAGAPSEALAAALRQLGLVPEAAPEHEPGVWRVDLGDRAPGPVVRALAAAGELSLWTPEPVTLESLYLRAQTLAGDGPPAVATVPPGAPAAAAAAAAAAAETPLPLWRTFRHELATLRHGRGTFAAALVAPAVAAVHVVGYHHDATRNLARVQAGQLFSADAGSGHLAVAQALQTALPVLALVLLWLGSQNVAADLARDTLRNTLVRAVARGDVLLGKLGALAAATLALAAVTVAAAATTAGALLGFADLDEVSRHGDRQTLAAAADVAPVLRQALGHCLLPLLAVATTALCASTLARRPARALAAATLLVLGPELLRPRLGAHGGWLLTSHLPTGLRDDSVLGYAAAVARGASDAHWPWAAHAVVAPLAWLSAAAAIAFVALRRQRIA